jgi:hypothetical protein
MRQEISGSCTRVEYVPVVFSADKDRGIVIQNAQGAPTTPMPSTDELLFDIDDFIEQKLVPLLSPTP